MSEDLVIKHLREYMLNISNNILIKKLKFDNHNIRFIATMITLFLFILDRKSTRLNSSH